MSSNVNPFKYGGPVPPERLLGREHESRRALDRLYTGQSLAITGQPHVGKTSLLGCISDASWRSSQKPGRFNSTFFTLIDAQLLRASESPRDFWEKALAILEEQGIGELSKIYNKTRAAQFETFSLKRLFSDISETHARLVILIDEFDVILGQPGLNCAEFYGSLRSLASTTPGLSYVISSRYDLAKLNQLTQAINPHGSPYFNTLTEIEIGGLRDQPIEELVSLLEKHMLPSDFYFVKSISGGHPYIAQATASILWDLREDGFSSTECYFLAGKNLHRVLKSHFDDCWRFWTTETKQVATAIALAQIPSLLGTRRINAQEILENILDYASELLTLERVGIIAQDSNNGWSVQQGAFLWWLADEIRKCLRKGASDFGSWLQSQEIESLLTRQQKDRLEVAAKGTLAVLGRGTVTLIEAFAKGVAGTLTGNS